MNFTGTTPLLALEDAAAVGVDGRLYDRLVDGTEQEGARTTAPNGAATVPHNVSSVIDGVCLYQQPGAVRKAWASALPVVMA